MKDSLKDLLKLVATLTLLMLSELSAKAAFGVAVKPTEPILLGQAQVTLVACGVAESRKPSAAFYYLADIRHHLFGSDERVVAVIGKYLGLRHMHEGVTERTA